MTTKNNTKKEQWDPRTAFDPTKAFDPTTVIDLKKLFDPKTVYTTPSGTALHPRLTDPSSPFKKGGEYSAQLYFPPDVEAVRLTEHLRVAVRRDVIDEDLVALTDRLSA